MTEQEFEIVIEKNQTLDQMLHQVLNQALVAIGADAGSLMLVDDNEGILQIKARLGKPRSGRKSEPVYTIGKGSIAGEVAATKEPYLCEDVDEDEHFVPSRGGTRNFVSLLSVPIVHNGKVLAVINADSEFKSFFTPSHRDKLLVVAEKVAGPIAERISILDALAQLAIELFPLPEQGGVDPVLEKIADLAKRSLGADLVTVYEYDQDRDEFPVAGKGPRVGGNLKDEKPMKSGIYRLDVPSRVVHERKSGFYPNVREHDFLSGDVERPGEPPRARFIDREGIQSMAALLLPYRAADHPDEEVVGAMFANYRTTHEFNIDDVKALATFADYAAIAITNARREEQRRAELMEMEVRRRAEQMRIMRALSGNLAHRIHNTAGKSRGYAQLIKEKISTSETASHEGLDQIIRDLGVLVALATRLARPFKDAGELLELVPLDVNLIVEQELAKLNLNSMRITVKLSLAQDLPPVQCVESQLREVTHDILLNAVDSMQDHPAGRLLICTRLDERKKLVEIDISDNGRGVAERIRNSLFELGATTKEDSLGMGLWWSRTFMQVVGGDVVLKESKADQGATFTVQIPCAQTREKRRVDVLIVDDDAGWLTFFSKALEGEPHSLESAENYTDAWRTLTSSNVKLAILDIRLQEADPQNKDGLRLLEEIDRASLDTKAIIVTGYGTEQDRNVANRNPSLLAWINKQELDLKRFRELVRHGVGRP